jgi:hypothetical protein
VVRETLCTTTFLDRARPSGQKRTDPVSSAHRVILAASRATLLHRAGALRDDSHLIIDDLEKPALDLEAVRPRIAPNAQRAATEEGHHRGVTGEDTDLPIVRGSHQRVRFSLEEHRLGRDH